MGIGKDIFIEIYYGKYNGVLLGAELIGEKGVDKRVDVLATAVYAKLCIDDLSNLDLAYAPPYSPAKGPVVVAGFVAQDFTYNPKIAEISPNQIEELNPDIILDLRNPSEIENTSLITKNTLNIPLEKLRDELDKLDKSKSYLVYCAKGLRGYIGSLILANNHFKHLTNLDGGYTAWSKMN